MSASGPDEAVRVGLCARCAHARVQGSARGSRFWRCAAADEDPRRPRYPPLPVTRCDAFRSAAPRGAAAPADPRGSKVPHGGKPRSGDRE